MRATMRHSSNSQDALHLHNSRILHVIMCEIKYFEPKKELLRPAAPHVVMHMLYQLLSLLIISILSCMLQLRIIK
jgi:hypothetical protein